VFRVFVASSSWRQLPVAVAVAAAVAADGALGTAGAEMVKPPGTFRPDPAVDRSRSNTRT
jgi:hypothetical protein